MEKLCKAELQASALLWEKLKGIRAATEDAAPSPVGMPGLSRAACSHLSQTLSKPPAALEPVDAATLVIKVLPTSPSAIQLWQGKNLHNSIQNCHVGQKPSRPLTWQSAPSLLALQPQDPKAPPQQAKALAGTGNLSWLLCKCSKVVPPCPCQDHLVTSATSITQQRQGSGVPTPRKNEGARQSLHGEGPWLPSLGKVCQHLQWWEASVTWRKS